MAYDALNADQRGNAGPNGKMSLTIDEAAAQLTRAGPSWSNQFGEGTTVTYAYRQGAPAQMPDGVGGFRQFDANQIAATESALALWAGMANIRFERVSSNGYSNDATILFGNYSTGDNDAAAFASLPGNRASSSQSGDVWINVRDLDNSWALGSNDEGFDTLLHEIGHAIGLLHPSDYDADGEADITYQNDASYFEDSGEYSIMSYFAASETGASIGDRVTRPGGPLIDDIAAVQRLYGANTATNGSDTVYGRVYAFSGILPAYYLTASQYPQALWGSIWDAGGIDTLDMSGYYGDVKLDLRAGSFSTLNGVIGGLSIAQGVMIENATGGSGNDILIGNGADNILNGKDGNDRLVGGLGGDTFIGSDGDDRAVLNGNVGDYSLLSSITTGAFILLARNGSGNQFIDASTESVEFLSGQYLSVRDLSVYVNGVGTAGNDRITAPGTMRVGGFRLDGGAGEDRLVLNGNVNDYVLSRTFSGEPTGDFVLTARNGSGIYQVSEATETIEFRNGQYLSLKDLPAYVDGDATLRFGGSQEDLLFQTGNGTLLFSGGNGNDTLYLRGNVQDYTIHETNALVLVSGGAPTTLHGFQLQATNGSGSILIGDDIESIVFQNGRHLGYGELPGTILPDTSSSGETLIVPGVNRSGGYYDNYQVSGTSGQDRLLVDRDVSGFTLTRDFDGTFGLITRLGYDGPSLAGARGEHGYSISASVETVTFADGQYLSLADLPRYVLGNPVFTHGGDVDDILIPSATGNGATLIGGGGFDKAYLNHNVEDYTLSRFERLSGYEPVSGYQLQSRDASQVVQIDHSVEEVHFANGQYLAFADLPAYIAGDVAVI